MRTSQYPINFLWMPSLSALSVDNNITYPPHLMELSSRSILIFLSWYVAALLMPSQKGCLRPSPIFSNYWRSSNAAPFLVFLRLYFLNQSGRAGREFELFWIKTETSGNQDERNSFFYVLLFGLSYPSGWCGVVWELRWKNVPGII